MHKIVIALLATLFVAGQATWALAEEEKKEGAAAPAAAEERKETAPEPTTAKGWFLTGHSKMESGDLSGAVEAFQKAKETLKEENKKDRCWAMNNVGLCHIRAKKWDEAQAALEEATQLDDSNAKAWNNLGTVFIQKEDFGKAAECFEKAIKIKPEYQNAKAQLAYCKSRLGEEGKKEEAAPPEEKKEAPKAEEKKAEGEAPKG